MREPAINIAIEAARMAGNTIVRAMKRLDTVKVAEKQPNDFVTEVDQRVEQQVIAIIKKAYPTHSIISEECGEIEGESDYQWIIDPIDGTRNFIHGYPHFAISIAIAYKNKIEHGVIYDPILQELFTASRGKGAQLNERRIRVSQRKSLSESLLSTGFAYRHIGENTTPSKVLHSIIPVCGDIRRTGAATLDLAYVACGRLDCYWEFGLHLWDMAAGVLLVKEAGGIVCDPYSGENYLKSGNVVAANPSLTRQFLKTIKPQLDESE